MNKLILILLCIPIIGVGQQTFIPDDWFETYLENNGMGNGFHYDDSVFTSAIDTVTYLDLSYGAGQSIGVFDLTGIEDFTDLESFNCSYNLLTSLDVSQNTALTYLLCDYNQLTSLDVSNGNNQNFSIFNITNNPNLYCINVDDVTYSTINWTSIDSQHYFSTNCPPSAIQEHSTNKELLKVTDLLGRETKQTNQPLFYIYDDGTVEKKIIIE